MTVQITLFTFLVRYVAAIVVSIIIVFILVLVYHIFSNLWLLFNLTEKGLILTLASILTYLSYHNVFKRLLRKI